MRKILSKILFCNENDLGNVILHFPLGYIVTGISFALYLAGFPILSVALMISMTHAFVWYEISERPIIHDKGFPEIQGYMWGLATSMAIVAIVWLLLYGTKG